MIKLRFLNISYERGRQILLFLFCLFLAFIIWSIHKLSESYTVYMQYKVTASVGLEGRSSEADSENLLIVRGKATGFYIIQHRFSGVESRVRISPDRRAVRKRAGVKDGFFILVKDVNEKLIQSFGNNVFVESFTTDSLFFLFPGQTNKRVPVKSRFSISFASQHMLASQPRVTPDSVTIYGESSLLSQIDSVFTKGIKLDNLNSPAEGMAELIPMAGVRFSQGDILYYFDVVRYVEKSWVVPVTFVNLPPGAALKASPAEVLLYYRERFDSSPVEQSLLGAEADYLEFENSLSGVVKVRLTGEQRGILSWRAEPPFIEVRNAVSDTVK
ncbi:MAG: hypothetical protein BGO30_06430 [Bacteroidetes bacterium 41-46]|nr:MAG: hypothetical protein BGO30_06430 [Bacteroidetes bacterium 41-46]